MDKMKIKAKNFKCFAEDPQGFEGIFPINVIIGRNNAGKSALIDLVEYVINKKEIRMLGHKGQSPEVLITKKLTANEITGTFPSNTSGGSIGINHQQYGLQWLDHPITFRLFHDGKEFVSVDPEFTHNDSQDTYIGRLTSNISIPLEGKLFRRINAERDILPEVDQRPNDIEVKEDGKGATNIVQSFLSKEHLDSSLVENTFLKELNSIFEPDASFSRIRIQLLKDSDSWEIFLDQEKKGSIKLSNSGSGLKTVILVLINTILIPYLKKEPLSKFVFAFEEMENNLHPGIQRRLLAYLLKLAKENEGCFFFLTTHSNVFIDAFSKEDIAQIIHIQHDNETSCVKQIKTRFDGNNLLDDLGIKASDLLQTNGLIWIEGPSDRTYMKKWIELLDDSLKEGFHYSFQYYGGRVLSHYTVDDEEYKEFINMLLINRNGFVIMDSDLTTDFQNSDLRQTKQRIIEECKKNKIGYWVTHGREIENYLTNPVLTNFAKKNITRSRFGKIETYCKEYKDKVRDSKKIGELMDKRELSPKNFDLLEKIQGIVNEIKRWNEV